jgi:hypothetical protein
MIWMPRMAFGAWGEDPELDAMRVRALLELVTQVNEQYLRRNPRLPGCYEAGLRGVKYAFVPTERNGDDPFADLLVVLQLGYGDCDDLAPYRCAELRVRHGMPRAVCDFTVHRINGADEYHIFVRRPDGMIDDPSRALGM